MRLFLVVLINIWVVGCSSTGSQDVVQPEDAVILSGNVYKIGEGDALNVSVWRNPELSVSVPVRPDGKISVPLIGDIKASGLEPEELSNSIRSKLAGYIKNPQVTVVVTNAVSSEFLHRVRVTGAVNAPSSVAYSKGMTVMDLVLVTGGITVFADANNTHLYRNTVSGVKSYRIKLADILEKGDISTNYSVQPGDIITVPERMF
jgi:polysaccharide export outer membrane protein